MYGYKSAAPGPSHVPTVSSLIGLGLWGHIPCAGVLVGLTATQLGHGAVIAQYRLDTSIPRHSQSDCPR
jgi:hypothetical protein